MSCLQNEGKLNIEKLTVIERERNKKVVLKFRTRFSLLMRIILRFSQFSYLNFDS
jgi:hypothetical protein